MLQSQSVKWKANKHNKFLCYMSPLLIWWHAQHIIPLERGDLTNWTAMGRDDTTIMLMASGVHVTRLNPNWLIDQHNWRGEEKQMRKRGSKGWREWSTACGLRVKGDQGEMEMNGRREAIGEGREGNISRHSRGQDNRNKRKYFFLQSSIYT